jgi:enamine deaminase RidA (YjgF/YER057c/UK114 family)
MMRLILAAMMLVAVPCAARAPGDVLMPTDPAALAQQSQYGYADAVIAGDMIYLSGVIAAPKPGDKGLQPAYIRAFDQIGATLKRAGASWDDVVDINTFHTDLAAQIYEIAAVKDRYVKAPFPAWTAIGITSLVEPTGITEIKIVARKPKR